MNRARVAPCFRRLLPSFCTLPRVTKAKNYTYHGKEDDVIFYVRM